MFSKYIDRCDICHQPKHCRGYEDKILCENCIEKMKNNNKKELKKDLTLFDFE